jgi:hypothetical protein
MTPAAQVVAPPAPPTHPPDVLAVHSLDVALASSVQAPVDPGQLLVAGTCQLLAGCQGAQALLAGHNHARVLGDLGLDLHVCDVL